MKKQILGGVLLVAVVVAFVFYYFYSAVTTAVLVQNGWDVEGNGMYNHIAFDTDGSFMIYAYPEEVGKGKWTLENRTLVLDFNDVEENREYTKMKFNHKGKITSITDENVEYWVAKELVTNN